MENKLFDLKLFGNFSGIILPIKLNWKVQNVPSAGGYDLMIDFKAKPYGICTFDIGSPSKNDYGSVLFTTYGSCGKLLQKLGEKQVYQVHS